MTVNCLPRAKREAMEKRHDHQMARAKREPKKEILVPRTVQNACNSYAKNRAKCVKLICKKQCKMRAIHMQKTERNAWNSYAENSEKCVKLICKKQCEMRSEFRGVFCIEIWRIFSGFFFRKTCKNCMVIFYNFQAFSWWFLWDCVQGWERRDPGQIPV